MLAPRAQEGGDVWRPAWWSISLREGWQPPDSQWEAVITGTGQSQITAHLLHSLVWWWRGPRHWMGLATEFMGWLSVLCRGCRLRKLYFIFVLCSLPLEISPRKHHKMPWTTDETLIFRSAPGMQLATLLSRGLSTSCPCQHWAVICTFSKFQSASNNYPGRPQTLNLGLTGQLLRLRGKHQIKSNILHFTSPLTISVSHFTSLSPLPSHFLLVTPLGRNENIQNVLYLYNCFLDWKWWIIE